MKIYGGVAALTEFGQAKLLKQLKSVEPKIKSVRAEYLHFVDANKLTAAADNQLKTLLTYGMPCQSPKAASKGLQVLVTPRPGTISPWASKATDIIHNSGLAAVKRVERGTSYYIEFTSNSDAKIEDIEDLLHDRMTEQVLPSIAAASQIFDRSQPAAHQTVDILKAGKASLQAANQQNGFALADDEVDYLYQTYKQLGRNPTDVELMMFAQVNSEHCRHKIFNADWIIDGQKQPKSLFGMIRNTYQQNHQDVLSAYSDNAAVLKGPKANFFYPDQDHQYQRHEADVNIVIKVETHNHPTAIAPFPGAATGIGGEIRDEAATGRGGRSKLGLSGLSVSNLNIPGAAQPWESQPSKPGHIASALDIMLQAPIGGASFANEFGRPNLAGYFRSFEQTVDGERWGYHKPIMLAGGLGNIRTEQVEKNRLPVGAQLIVLGGPAMLIGLGGGAASSVQAGASDAKLDFASVQRANAEMQRRAQEVINACWQRGDKNPIISIHDVGAGGLSNALPELVHDSGRGAIFELRQIPNDDPAMSPMQIWSNESQERYVLGINKTDLASFTALCQRERCPFAVVGQSTKEEQLIINDSLLSNRPVDIPMSVLFGKPPKMVKQVKSAHTIKKPLKTESIVLDEAIQRVLHLPSVGSKQFLITIGDRTVGGLTARDQMVGPWQVPVSDVAVTSSSFGSPSGEAVAIGERAPLALIDAAASARVAVAEAITNIAAAPISKLSDIKLSANWMAASGHGQEDQRLFEAVKAVGMDFCPQLGLTIPVGKDSLSMRTKWADPDEQSVTSPVSLLVTAFSPVLAVEQTLTPQIQPVASQLLLIDLGQGHNRLGGSALAQVYNQIGNQSPDIEAKLLAKFFKIIQKLNKAGKLLAYHDRSDGGLLTTLLEMAFAGRCGLDVDLASLPGQPLGKLFNEELGAVIQVAQADCQAVTKELQASLGDIVHQLAQPAKRQQITIMNGRQLLYKNSRSQLQKWWAETSYRIQSLRDNLQTSQQEYGAIDDDADMGLFAKLSYDPSTPVQDFENSPRPRVAIFREQGVNGQVEMAAAFHKAGFAAIDVHLNDLMDGTVNLDDFVGLVACGGFSYGDVLGAGEGWAKSILFNPKLKTMFSKFFNRSDSFTLGVCNGCQMLSALKELIPGAQNWPSFERNLSEQFEARLAMVQIVESASIFFKGMAGSQMPVPVAHGEGRAVFSSSANLQQAEDGHQICARYIDSRGQISEVYPANPNGSPQGITALTSVDGRATIMMPHPERAFLTQQYSWHPADWAAQGPWLRMFQNARTWVEQASPRKS
ncbi:MAG: phosphoribosylformylglycinamidine synthase [Candidatus Saccharimonadales bacterium]